MGISPSFYRIVRPCLCGRAKRQGHSVSHLQGSILFPAYQPPQIRVHNGGTEGRNSCSLAQPALIFFTPHFIYLFLAVLGLCRCMGFSLVAASGGCSLGAVLRLLIVVASLVAEHKLSNCDIGSVAPQHVGSSQIRARTHISCIGRWALYRLAPREAPSPDL